MTTRLSILAAALCLPLGISVAQIQAAEGGAKAHEDLTIKDVHASPLHQPASALHSGAPAKVTEAVAVLFPVANSGVTGTVYFTQHGKAVHIHGEVRGLTPGKHGFHVHEYGDLTSMKDGMSLGGHFNPTHMPHGRPSDAERHEGDFGNIVADDEGVAKIDVLDQVAELNGPHSILGRGLVVHAKEDKFTQPVGDAGARVAVGAIGVAQPAKK